uniref:MobA-like NTP transferase domain-containing protein n=1 Tax=viral metagenome TaxID=1070528 RepID=A0A6C0KF58_9ZZZZ
MIVLITTSGLGSRLGDLTSFLNKSIIRIGDKCPLDYIFDNYKNMSDVKFIITIGYLGDIVKQYVNIAYGNKLNITFVEVDNYEDSGSSLGYSLLKAKKYVNEPFFFHCCDAIILEKIDINMNTNNNILFGYTYNDSSHYSSLNISNGIVCLINEKGCDNYDYIYTGLAYIYNYKFFWEKLYQLYNDDPLKSNLSDIHAFNLMLKDGINFKFIHLKQYYDMGNMKSYNEIIQALPCNYNILYKKNESIIFHKDKVIKYFYDENINKNKLKRIKYIGENLVPKIFSKSKNYHSMELIDSMPLSEIYEKGLIYKLLVWADKNLWVKNKNIDNFENICYNFYYTKTWKRIKKYFNDKRNIDYNIINNVNVGSIDNLLKKINFKKLCKDPPTNYHGDFILDNILLRKNKEFCLIDWRQDFGGDIERGDKYYDLAKLQHNIYFNHSNINKNLFNIKIIDENRCEVDMKCNFFLINQMIDFDKFIIENNIDKKKINILNGLIWINMAPLHNYPLSNFLFNLGKYMLINNI